MISICISLTRHLSLLLALACLLPWQAHAKGGDTQPARTLGERWTTPGACDPGLQELPPCIGDDCKFSSSRCYKSPDSFQQFHGCGGSNQRACTVSERPTVNDVPAYACRTGFGEALGCTGNDCGTSITRCYQSIGAYQQFRGCGGASQRGCTAGEWPTILGETGKVCSPGLGEGNGCEGECYGSSSRCFPSLAAYQQFHQCGGANQRACTVGERPTIGGIAGGACSASLLEVSGCSVGDCRGSTSHCESKDNSTYVRCFYKKDTKASSVDTDSVWALQENSDSYYTLNGYWYGQYGVAGANMFYTETSQQDVRNICADTLARKGLQRPAGFFAADTRLSFNYTIWTNDLPQKTGGVNKVIVFGDSLSDNGNLFNLTNWVLPSRSGWYLGRFSNGPVWVDYLAEGLNVPLYNWSFGGATALTNKIPIPRLNEQVANWQAYMRSAKNYDPANTLFVVLIGANDITAAPGNVPALSADVESGLKKLVGLGAKRILMLNLPDIAKSPEVQNANKARAPGITADVNQYNANLQAIADRIRNLGSTVVLVDAHALIDRLLSKPGVYGFRVTDRQCLYIDWNLGPAKYALPHWPTKECTADDAKGWVFWDGSHPTTAVHKVLADEVSKVITPLLQ